MEAIIFDVDGTLWDAKDEIVYSWNLALEGWPQITKRLTGEMMTPELGKPMDEIMDDLFQSFRRSSRSSWLRICTGSRISGSRRLPAMCMKGWRRL